jgi:uncharacterized protein (DUF2235 family)
MNKNIVLFSDGTGNSAAKPFKTNVWRLYQAIDTVPPTDPKARRQIAFYDEGVGTDNIKPLAILGGALGLGVWSNVRDLYTFVCRNYQPGDQIYAFGFSRGAFTVRLLVGLIGRCGIVKGKPDSEAKLLEAVQMAYEAYRRDFLIRASKQRGMIYHYLLRPPHYHSDKSGRNAFIALPERDTIQFQVDIAFLGVWDTVDAYGMPVDELKLAIDRWVWPMSFADRELSPRVQMARHALSLDDERPTFRPVLWNELAEAPRNPAERRSLSPQQVQQVWFAGVHANVGGGYADDGLAYVALDWMMEEAGKAQLRFLPGARETVRERADAHGEHYDSRSGLAGYYRYGPRRVAELCNDADHKVQVPTVRVHTAVFDRITRHQVDYAPVSLNRSFNLVGGSPEQYPGPEFLKPEAEALEQAWDVVWWKRLAYFASLATTGAIALIALHQFIPAADRIVSAIERFLQAPILIVLPASLAETLRRWFVGGIDAVAGVLPGWAAWALQQLSDYPIVAIISVGLLAWLFFRKSEDLQRRIDARAEWAWAAQKGLDPKYAPAPSVLNRLARAVRLATNRGYQAVFDKLVINVLGIIIGVVAFFPILLVGLLRQMFKRRPWLADGP